MKKIGLLGGTFDPPHLGHMIIANEVLHQLDLDEIWFIPTNKAPHKQSTKTANDHRKQMVQIAIKDNAYFHIHTIELERTGKSFTIETIKQLHKMYDHTFYFIIGGDMIEYLPKWHKIDELVELIQFVGVGRIGYEEKSNYPVELLQIPMIDISSSEIRKRLKDGHTVKYFLQEDVYKYIKEHHLYDV